MKFFVCFQHLMLKMFCSFERFHMNSCFFLFQRSNRYKRSTFINKDHWSFYNNTDRRILSIQTYTGRSRLMWHVPGASMANTHHTTWGIWGFTTFWLVQNNSRVPSANPETQDRADLLISFTSSFWNRNWFWKNLFTSEPSRRTRFRIRTLEGTSTLKVLAAAFIKSHTWCPTRFCLWNSTICHLDLEESHGNI